MARITTPPKPTAAPRLSGAQGAEPGGRLVVALIEEPAHHVEQVVDRLRGVQDRLVLRDVVLVYPHFGDVQGADLRAAELLDLPVGGEQPGPIGPHLAVFVDDAELDRE